MAVTTTFSWRFVKNLDISNGPANGPGDVSGLVNGGFAAVGVHGPHFDGDIFDAGGNMTGTWGINSGTAVAIDHLSNGNLVTASQVNDTVVFHVYDGATGAPVVGETVVAVADTPDVAALPGGGFWVVSGDGGPGGGHNIIANIYNSNTGGIPASLTIDASPASEREASVAALDNGLVAVAWTRTTGGESEIWYAVYNAAGTIVVKAPTLLDSVGTINRDASVAASNGGFVIAYESNSPATGSIDIVLARLDSTGALLGASNVSNPALANDFSNDATPYVTRLGNGLLAVAYGDNSNAHTDTIVKLVDPATGAILASRNIVAGEPLGDDVSTPNIAGFGLGALAVFHSNLSDDDIDGEHLQGVRTSTGNNANDAVTGDDFVDLIRGGSGNDTLNGAGNADDLRGGSGNDILNGGAGADLIVGDAGNDTITGGTEVDRLFGGSGNDQLFGGAGADSLVGGPGIDRLDGGDGADRLFADGTGDTFVFGGLSAAGDRVFNFVSGVHDLEIDGSGFGGAAGAFAFVSGATPNPGDGQQTLLYDTDDGKLFFDADGTGAGLRVHVLTLIGAPTLAAGDIVLV